VNGLQGGTAPARAFASFMSRAVANRPVENFDTKVTLPEWQLEPDEESYFGQADNGAFVDADGNPVAPPDAEQPADDEDAAGDAADSRDLPRAPPPVVQPGQQLNQDWLDRVTGRDRGGAPPPRQPGPREVPRQPERVQPSRDDL
jgi:penicillin-binding protein 1A